MANERVAAGLVGEELWRRTGHHLSAVMAQIGKQDPALSTLVSCTALNPVH